MVNDCRHIAFDPGLMEDGLDQIYIRQMHAAGGIWVVHDVDVFWLARVAIFTDDVFHRIRKSTKVNRQGQALGDDTPKFVKDSRGEIHGVPNNRGVCGAHDCQRHFISNRAKGILNDF
ncbi:hypothetical protein D3C76_1606960 [compost metagenome]